MKRLGGAHSKGFSMVEVLVTMVLILIGLVGLAGLQAKTSAAEMEGYQRVQAMLLAQDMADRIAARKGSASSYVANNYGTGAQQSCTGLSGYQLDTCNWGNALRGAAEKSGTANVGTLLGGRGCITSPATNQYAVVVVWQGLVGTAAPSVPCGLNSYGTEKLRRAVVVPVTVADLVAS